MSTQASMNFGRRLARLSKKQQIIDFFTEQCGEIFTSSFLHGRFGSATRTRISEINRDESCPIYIKNHCGYDDVQGVEMSCYWSVKREAR